MTQMGDAMRPIGVPLAAGPWQMVNGHFVLGATGNGQHARIVWVDRVNGKIIRQGLYVHMSVSTVTASTTTTPTTTTVVTRTAESMIAVRGSLTNVRLLAPQQQQPPGRLVGTLNFG
ncbi:unnamed protein product [Sphagnum balticum]